VGFDFSFYVDFSSLVLVFIPL